MSSVIVTTGADLVPMLPALVPVGGLVLVLLLDAFFPREAWLARPVGIVALLGAAATLAPTLLAARPSPLDLVIPPSTLCLPADLSGLCLYVADRPATALQLGILLSCAAVLVIAGDRVVPLVGQVFRPALREGAAVEVGLVLAVATGGVGVVAARDLGSWLVLLELATLPTIALVALHTGRRAPGAALSLLTTSLVSFAFLVLGAALWLVSTATPLLSDITIGTAVVEVARASVLMLAVVALVAGLGFKLSLVPFQAWTPTTFSGSSLPVATLLATASKLAAVGALLVIVAPFDHFSSEGERRPVLVGVLAALALLSMLLGNLVALRADDPVRLLAFSTIGQAGWVVLPLIALSPASRAAAAGYALTYAVATLVAFAAVNAVGPVPDAARPLTAFTGLLRTRPLIGWPLALALLVLAGLPPGFIGLIAKVQALRPVVDAGYWPLAVAAVIAVVLGIAVYARWFALLVRPAPVPVEGAEGAQAAPTRLGRGSAAVLAIGTFVLVATSLVPRLLWGLL